MTNTILHKTIDLPMAECEEVLRVEHLVVEFRSRSRGEPPLRAVDDVSLVVHRGETVGVVGESGSGKSSLARAIVRLVEPISGSVVVNGLDTTGFSREKMRLVRVDLQMMFQDPYSSLNPRMRVVESITAPLRIQGIEGTDARIAELLDMVSLSGGIARRFPYELSGGQRQRVALARALAVRPKVLILDEPVSALDVSLQAQVLNLLIEIQRHLGLAYVFISHDLAVVNQVCDRVAVMYLGKIIEEASTTSLFLHPQHPYTVALKSAVPVANPVGRAQRRRIVLQGELPSIRVPPAGCHFHTRCWKVKDLCRVDVPLLSTSALDHTVACWFPEPA